MDQNNIIYIPAHSIEIINRVKDSKFFGNISTVTNREEAEKFINKIKNKYSDATHNVNAYRIGNEDKAIEYADDDGEPAGSSGPPVLQAIKGKEFTNTVIVVTRYFGGTKLGIGGLIRAYGETARMALKKAGRKKLKIAYKINISGEYQDIGTIMGQIESHQGKIVNTSYNNQGAITKAWILPDQYNQLKNTLNEMTGGRASIKFIGKKYILDEEK